MGEEEKVERKSVLSPEEIDFVAGLIADGKDGASDRILLTEQRGLFMEQRLREVWDAWQSMKLDASQSEKWENVLKRISKIPENANLNLLKTPDYYGKASLGGIARVSVMMLFKNVVSHLNAEQVKLVDDVLRRVDKDGQGLSKKLWKGLLFENAKKSLLSNADEMVETVTEAGIDKQEYIREVLRPMILELAHNASQADLTSAVLSRGNLLTDIDKFYGFDNFDREQKERLLAAGDDLLEGWYKEYGPLRLEKACQVYEWLDEKGMDIDKRVKIVDTRERYIRKVPVWGQIGDLISCRLCEMKIRAIAKRLKII